MDERRNKVLFIVEAMGGGVFTYIVDLANELVNIYDIYIAYAIRKQTPENYEEYFDKRVHLVRVMNFERSINPIKDIKAFGEIRRIAEDIRPDVIHLHSSKAGVLGRWAFNGKKISLFYTPHGYSFLMQNKNLAKRLIYKLIEMISGYRNCTTISCSEGEYEAALKLTKRATYVNNGINIRELQKLLNSVPIEATHPFTVFTLGRICHQKNPVIFNEIALAMPDVHFVWIGDGELREKLSAPNIEVTGWCEREDALRKALQGDVFILTSLWEGLPISLLEAMYMKKLCIVSDVVGNHDIIHTGENGFVCKDINAFIKAIIIAQEKDVKPLVDKAYSDIMSIYNAEVMSRKYSELYKREMRQRGTV